MNNPFRRFFPTRTVSLLTLFEAIRYVETGDRDPGDATRLGDQGRSYGPYQIMKDYHYDAGIAETYSSVSREDIARKAMLCYWHRYLWGRIIDGKYLNGMQRILIPLDVAEELARTHNGGPNGALKTSTDMYWKKVKARLGL